MIKIDEFINSARKNGQVENLEVFKMVKTSFQEAEKVDGKELTEEKKIKILSKMVSERKAVAETYSNNGRQSMADKELFEAKVIEDALLPKLPTSDEIKACVNDVIAKLFPSGTELKMSDMKVIRPAVLEAMPLADGKEIAKAVTEVINK